MTTRGHHGLLLGAGGGGGDPYFSSVVSLMHFNGADGSTTFTDETGRAWSATSGAEIDTAQSVFGGASAYFPSSPNGYISTPSSADLGFGTGDFTIEFFGRRGGFPHQDASPYIDLRAGGSNGIVLHSTSSNADLLFNAGGATRITAAQSVNTWYHIALSRVAGTTRLFSNGVSAGSYADSNNYAATSALLGKYYDSATFFLFGHMDELRITKGVGRYTADFTPPSAQFPDS